MAEIIPCPFCSSKAIKLWPARDMSLYGFVHLCRIDGEIQVKVESGKWFDTEKDAIKAWNRRAEKLGRKQKHWVTPETDTAAKRLNNLIFDINPAEICSQIESDNLRKWCFTIQTEMKMAMVQLPCWGEGDE